MRAALRQVEAELGDDWIVFRGTDGTAVRIRAAAALDAFLAALGGQDPGLPDRAAEWMAEVGEEGDEDITAVIVRHYRSRKERNG
jgi:hypothetical protein